MTHPGVDGCGRTTAWFPESPCDDRCRSTGARSGAPRAAVRGAALLAVLVVALGSAPALVVLPPRARSGWVRLAARAVLAAAGIAVTVRGTAGPGGALVVANHLSWIEVLALAATVPGRLLAKHEVGRWPVVGAVARAAGTLFVERDRLHGLPGTVAAVAAVLHGGDSVIAFPEGTTWFGAAAGPFRRAVFQAAVDGRAPVRPVAVVLRRGVEVAHAASFVGPQTLLDSVHDVLRLDGLVCELTLLPAIAPAGGRAALAARAGAAVAAVTGIPHPDRARAGRGVLAAAGRPRRAAGAAEERAVHSTADRAHDWIA